MKTLFKTLFALVGVIAILVICCVLLAPLFFSTHFGNQMLAKMVSRETGFKVDMGEISLSWFGTQSAKRVRVHKESDQFLMTCEEIDCDASLIKIIFQEDVGHLTLKKPDLELKGNLAVRGERKHPYLQAGLAGMPSMRLNVPMQGKVVIEDGKMVLNPPSIEPIVFDQIAMSLDVIRGNEIALQLSSVTRQGSSQGMIAIKGSATEIHSSFPNMNMQVSISQLPVEGIDRIAALFSPQASGLITAAVGPTVDVLCNATAALGNVSVNLTMISPQIKALFSTETAGGVVSLKSPAQFSLMLTPDLMQKLANVAPSLKILELKAPAQIQGTLSQFSCPIPAQAEDLMEASFQGKLEAPPQLVFSLNGAPFVLGNFLVSVSSKAIGKEATFSLNTNLQTGAGAGSVSLEGSLSQLFTKDIQGSVTLNGDKLPSDLLGIVFDSGVAPSMLLGPTFAVKGNADLNKANPTLHVSWQSQLLNIPAIDLSLKNPMTLLSPAPFALGLNPQLLSLGKMTSIQGILQTLVIPEDNSRNIKLTAVATASAIELTGALPFSMAKLNAALDVNTLDAVSLKLDGETLKATLFGALKPGTFVLNRPLKIEYMVDNAFLKALAPDAPNLQQPALVQISIDPTSLPLSGVDLNALNLKGQISSPEIALEMISLQNTTLPFEWNAKSKTASVQIASKMQNPSGAPGSLQGQMQIADFILDKGMDLSRAVLQGELDLQNISTCFIETFMTKLNLSGIIGPVFSGAVKLQSSCDKQNIAFKCTSNLLNIDSAWIVDSSGLRLQGSANQLNWTLTPDSYKILDAFITGQNKGAPPFELKENSTFAISLSKLTLPVSYKNPITTFSDRFPHIAFDVAKLQLTASGQNPSLAFYDTRSKETIQLANMAFNVGRNGEGAPLTASLDTGIVTQSNSQYSTKPLKNGSLSLEGKLIPTLNSAGNFDPAQLTCTLQIKAQQLPSRALDILARAQGRTDSPFSTFFGDMINGQMTMDLTNFSGPVSLKVNAPNTRLDVDGQLASGTLLLNNPLYAQTKITPEMSRLILKEVNPLNLSYVYSLAPVTLEIPAKGFYLPLYPYSVSKMAIPSATIELGKIVCRNEGNVNTALSLLKSRQFEKTGELSLWFAPIDFSVKQGIAAIERTEILLADTFDICVWGNYDLTRHYVDMILGLTAQTLNRAFGVKNVPENYVLTIPMKGPADNVQINTNKATAKVTLLLAWQNKILSGAVGGGTAGAIFGEVIGKMATLPDSDAKVPPAKHPFPWEVSKGSKTSEASSSHEKKRQFKGSDKPLKQILKVLR